MSTRATRAPAASTSARASPTPHRAWRSGCSTTSASSDDDNRPAVVTRALQSFAAAVWEIVQVRRLRRDRESEVCLPFFLRPRRVSGASGCDDSPVSVTALTSAEISLPAEADGQRVSDRIAVLADTVDVVGLTDNHAGQPRMSPLAAVAIAREQGVGTIVHVSCRDRNRLALQSQVVGAAALGAEGVLCMQGDPVAGVDHVADMTATELIARAPG